MQLSGLVSDTGNANLWQKTSCCPQHLLCPSSSHEKLIWLELWREAGGMQGEWLLLGRGKRGEFPYSALLTLKPSSFLLHLDSCNQDSPFPCTPWFLPHSPLPRKDSGPTAWGSSSEGWVSSMDTGQHCWRPTLWGCAAVTPQHH